MAIQAFSRGTVLQVDVWFQTGVPETEVTARLRAMNPDISDRDAKRIIDMARARTISEWEGQNLELRRDAGREGDDSGSVTFRRFSKFFSKVLVPLGFQKPVVPKASRTDAPRERPMSIPKAD